MDVISDARSLAEIENHTTVLATRKSDIVALWRLMQA